jgi:hypothetical protein
MSLKNFSLSLRLPPSLPPSLYFSPFLLPSLPLHPPRCLTPSVFLSFSHSLSCFLILSHSLPPTFVPPIRLLGRNPTTPSSVLLSHWHSLAPNRTLIRNCQNALRLMHLERFVPYTEARSGAELGPRQKALHQHDLQLGTDLLFRLRQPRRHHRSAAGLGRCQRRPVSLLATKCTKALEWENMER